MEAKLFLKNKLQELADKFENVKLSYFFDHSYSQHVIVVTPGTIYSDEVFAKEQVTMEIDFINHFPYESLYFVENESIEVTSEFEFECFSVHQNHLILNEFIENVLNKLFANNATVTINTSEHDSLTTSVVNSYKIVNDSKDHIQYQPIPVKLNGGENSYAMAA